jgi:outer membrane immunogenic protein
MNKIYQIIGALVLTTTTAMSDYGGIFVGAGLGVGMMRNDTKYVDATQGEGKSTVSKLGAYYQLHAGYLHEVGTSKTLVGGDIYVNGSSAKKLNNVGVDGGAIAGTIEQKRSTGVGIAAIMGKLINPKVMIYGRVGYELSKYDMKLNLIGVAPKDFTKSYNGIVPGVGLNYKIAHNMMIGGGYDYTGLFSNKTVYQNGDVNIQVKPAEHRMMVKLTFVFNPSTC